MSLRTYVVTPKAGGQQRLVKTTHPNRAISHVAADTLSAHVASQEDLERLLPAGVKVEKPGDEPAQEGGA